MKRLVAILLLAPAILLWTGRTSRGAGDLSDLCYTCHDAPKEYNGHHAGRKPSFQIPAKFKTSADGGLLCTTCHVEPDEAQQKKLGDDGGHPGNKWLVSDNNNGTLCGECHGVQRDYAGEQGKGHGHPVIDVGADNERAAKLISGGGKLGQDGLVICQTCHKAHGGVNDKMTVLPARNSELCLACHADRDVKVDGKVKNHPLGRRAARMTKEFKQVALTGTGGRIGCITCHKPHGAPGESSFLSVGGKPSDLCVSCHSNKNRTLNGKHGEGDGCKNCHTVHDAPSRRLIKFEVSGGIVRRQLELCRNCHTEGGSAERFRVSLSRSHPMGMKKEDAEPGFQRIVTCSACHSVHSGPAEPGGRVSYVKGRSGDGGLCAGCHQDEVSIASTPHAMKGGQYMCRQCHKVHSPRVKDDLFRRPLPNIAGATPAERECLSCHNASGLGKAKVPKYFSHPEEIEAMVVDGAKFYTAKGSKAKEGEVARIVCATCHAPHSTAGKFLRPSGPVVEWCAACHDTEGDKRYKTFHTAETRASAQ